jgi:hypothetical protein
VEIYYFNGFSTQFPNIISRTSIFCSAKVLIPKNFKRLDLDCRPFWAAFGILLFYYF